MKTGTMVIPHYLPLSKHINYYCRYINVFLPLVCHDGDCPDWLHRSVSSPQKEENVGHPRPVNPVLPARLTTHMQGNYNLYTLLRTECLFSGLKPVGNRVMFNIKQISKCFIKECTQHLLFTVLWCQSFG